MAYILIFYFLIVIGMGAYYSRRAKSTEDFILAGHSLSAPFVTGSVVATWLGGAVILGGASEAFVGGFQAIVWDPWSPVLTLLFSGFFLVSIFRRSRFTTTIDFYNARYSSGIGLAGMTVSVLAYISWLSAQLLSLGVIIKLTMGLDPVLATMLGAGIILAIALTGGLWALSRSDMLAFVVLFFVLLTVLPYALGAVGGVSAFIDKAGTLNGAPPFSLFYTEALNRAGEPTGFSGVIGILGVFYMLAAWFSVAIGDLGGSVLTARALAAKSEAAATRGFVYGGFIYLILGMIPVIVGMCVFILEPAFPEQSLDDIFPWFVENHLPGWISALFFVAVASAIVSTAGDTILSLGALIGYSGYGVVRPQSNDQQRLFATRIVMVIGTVLALVVGLAVGDLYNLLVFAGAVSFPVLAAAFTGGLLWKKANITGAWSSMAVGSISWVILVFVLQAPVGGDIWDAIYVSSVPAFLLSVSTLVGVSLLTQKEDPGKPMVDVDGNDISGGRRFVWRES